MCIYEITVINGNQTAEILHIKSLVRNRPRAVLCWPVISE